MKFMNEIEGDLNEGAGKINRFFARIFHSLLLYLVHCKQSQMDSVFLSIQENYEFERR